MPRRISIAEETGSVATGGAIAGIVSTSADEVTHYSRENEEITRIVHDPTIDYCHPG
jgi:hypothetical protein